jgi:hypothetical protein
MSAVYGQDARQGVQTAAIVSVGEFLNRKALTIPVYQRPYKWTEKHIAQLLGDMTHFREKPSYRLGTIVLHREAHGAAPESPAPCNIVDGQQRTISLLLLIRALAQAGKRKLVDEKLLARLQNIVDNMQHWQFSSHVSQRNIRNNYWEIWRFVHRSDVDEQWIRFLLDGCELVLFELDDVAEAFQFFDSQNARGRDLDPHDLLKAFHLRQFGDDEQIKADTVKRWEENESDQLAALFSTRLYRMRRWSRGQSAREFGKADVALFKGINIDAAIRYPYAEQARIVHHVVDDYNRHFQRKLDDSGMRFPFAVLQPIINGRRFFDMVAHYDELGRGLSGTADLLRQSLPQHSDGLPVSGILDTINNYPGRDRTGDRYVRNAFDCLLICYVDKFGMHELRRAVELIFIWAYSLRLQRQAVQLATLDNYVLETGMFTALADAVVPMQFLGHSLPSVADIGVSKCESIYALFKKMRYTHEQVSESPTNASDPA